MSLQSPIVAKVREALHTEEPLTCSEIAKLAGTNYRHVFQILGRTKNIVKAPVTRGDRQFWGYHVEEPVADEEPAAVADEEAEAERLLEDAYENEIAEPAEVEEDAEHIDAT